MKTIFRTSAATLAITAAMAACAAVTAPTATAQATDGSGSLSQLVTGLVTTGSGPALLTGSNDAAAATGSSDLAGTLICGLIGMSSAGGPTICDTGIVG
ncbi:hypothetical protein [Nocardia sp. NPDC058705]|uniref:hypothetical protein n=1 Tax=Nocardia sp. NPDC058705 TaxID=3346609 RepID=UPI0036BA372D